MPDGKFPNFLDPRIGAHFGVDAAARRRLAIEVLRALQRCEVRTPTPGPLANDEIVRAALRMAIDALQRPE